MTKFKVTVKAIWHDVEVEVDDEILEMVGSLNRNIMIEESVIKSNKLDLKLTNLNISDFEEAE